MAKPQSGFSLLEVIVALGIGSVILLIFSQVTHDVAASMSKDKLIASRDEVVAMIRHHAENNRNIIAASNNSENVKLKDCICGSGCESSKPLPLIFSELSDPSTSLSRHYTASGIPCSKDAPNCLLEVTTQFMAQCLPVIPSSDPVPPLICVGPAEFISVTYKVQQNPLTIDQGHHFRTIQGTVFKMTSDIRASGACI